MSLRWMHVGFTVLVSAAASASIAVGCSSSSGTAPATPPLTQCPVTLDAANGASCQAGLTCPYLMSCGAFHQQTTCSCQSATATMACVTDATDASVPPGAAPVCVSLPDAAACPPSEPANLSACTSVGLQCVYNGLVCPSTEAGASLDTCECHGSGTSGGLVYECAIAECGLKDAGAGHPEGGTDGSVTDAGDGGGETDASRDAAGDDGG